MRPECVFSPQFPTSVSRRKPADPEDRVLLEGPPPPRVGGGVVGNYCLGRGRDFLFLLLKEGNTWIRKASKSCGKRQIIQ